MGYSLMEPVMYNGLCLAYIGDAVYEIYARTHALEMGFGKVKDLHQQVIKYTNAVAQARAIQYMLEQQMLNETEIAIYKRGRNSHVHTTRKNVELATYLDATGFEALVGYLYLQKDKERLEEVIEISFHCF